MVADVVGGKEGSGGAGKFLAVVGTHVRGGAERGEKVVFEGGGDSSGGAVREEAEQAELAIATDGGEEMLLRGIRWS